jgi:hypothetical protein
MNNGSGRDGREETHTWSIKRGREVQPNAAELRRETGHIVVEHEVE